jgi:hypothetical protein
MMVGRFDLPAPAPELGHLGPLRWNGHRRLIGVGLDTRQLRRLDQRGAVHIGRTHGLHLHLLMG